MARDRDMKALRSCSNRKHVSCSLTYNLAYAQTKIRIFFWLHYNYLPNDISLLWTTVCIHLGSLRIERIVAVARGDRRNGEGSPDDPSCQTIEAHRSSILLVCWCNGHTGRPCMSLDSVGCSPLTVVDSPC